MSGFGAAFKAIPSAAVDAAATPAAGTSAEVIWHQLYDTQTYTDAVTTRLEFFTQATNDRTLTNMPTPGILPRFQMMRIYNVCLDVLSIIPVTTSATITGVLNDLALLLIGSNQRPTWTLNISSKDYGPYSLSALHGTGGPDGFGFSGDGAEIIQYARNACWPGWNYMGRVTLREQVPFFVVATWAAAADMTEDKRLRLSFFGVLNRNIQ